MPAAPPLTQTTNQDSVLVSPLVVTVLFAQRTFASVLDCTTTMQPSAVDAASAASMICCGLSTPIVAGWSPATVFALVTTLPPARC